MVCNVHTKHEKCIILLELENDGVMSMMFLTSFFSKQ